jgi:hypothetical protein
MWLEATRAAALYAGRMRSDIHPRLSSLSDDNICHVEMESLFGDEIFERACPETMELDLMN